MAKFTGDRQFIEAALRGFEQQRAIIDEKMAELRQQLSRIRPDGPGSASAKPTRQRRELSPEARQRIAAAQRKRWARARRAKAAQATAANRRA